MSLIPLSPFELGAAGSLAAAVATGLGGLMVLLKRNWNPGRLDRAVGLAAALLIAASVLGLTLPAGRLLAPKFDDLGLVASLAAGLALGALGMRLLSDGTERLEGYALSRGPWLIILALALHNLPEGLAVGTAMGGPNPASGLPLLGGILLHDFMEGIAVASLALTWGWSPARAALAALLTGLSEPLMGIPAAWLTAALPGLHPWILLGTAGGMVIMLRREVLPLLLPVGPR